jgi:hypothetical protein
MKEEACVNHHPVQTGQKNGVTGDFLYSTYSRKKTKTNKKRGGSSTDRDAVVKRT